MRTRLQATTSLITKAAPVVIKKTLPDHPRGRRERKGPGNYHIHICSPNQCPGRFLGITGQYPSVCKSNQLHVDILRFSFIKLGYILYILLKWPIIFLQSWTSTGYSSNSTGSSITNCRFSAITAPNIYNIDRSPDILYMLPGGEFFKVDLTPAVVPKTRLSLT